MSWLKRRLRKWIFEEEKGIAIPEPMVTSDAQDLAFNLSILNAMNGKVIQIRSYQPQSRGPDWKNEYYIVPEGERLTDAVSVLLMAKNLEKA